MLDRMTAKREHEEFVFAAVERLSHKTRVIGKSVLQVFSGWLGRSTVFCYVSLMSMVKKSKLFMEYL